MPKIKTIKEYPKEKVNKINDKIVVARKLGMNTRGIFTNKTDIPTLERKLNYYIRRNSR